MTEEGFDFLHVYLLQSKSFNDTLVTRIKIYYARDKFFRVPQAKKKVKFTIYEGC